MEFSVPQFIERETRIVGPLTMKQFAIMGVAGGFGFILYFTVPFFYFIFITLILVGAAFALAFFESQWRTDAHFFEKFFDVYYRLPNLHLAKGRTSSF